MITEYNNTIGTTQLHKVLNNTMSLNILQRWSKYY